MTFILKKEIRVIKKENYIKNYNKTKKNYMTYPCEVVFDPFKKSITITMHHDFVGLVDVDDLSSLMRKHLEVKYVRGGRVNKDTIQYVERNLYFYEVLDTKVKKGDKLVKIDSLTYSTPIVDLKISKVGLSAEKHSDDMHHYKAAFESYQQQKIQLLSDFAVGFKERTNNNMDSLHSLVINEDKFKNLYNNKAVYLELSSKGETDLKISLNGDINEIYTVHTKIR